MLNALQADLPEILIADPTGGLSHISSLVEEVPFHGGEELTTAMMTAFIPVAMRSLIKVCLCLLCVVLHNLLYTATAALMPLMLIKSLPVIVVKRLTYMIAYLAIAELLLHTSRVTPSLQHEALVLAWLMLQMVSLLG